MILLPRTDLLVTSIATRPKAFSKRYAVWLGSVHLLQFKTFELLIEGQNDVGVSQEIVGGMGHKLLQL